jgi:hypothetical protein
LVPSPALAATIAASLLFLSSPAQAHIAIEQLPQPAQQQQQRQPVIPNPSAGFDPAAVGQIRGGCLAAACALLHVCCTQMPCTLYLCASSNPRPVFRASSSPQHSRSAARPQQHTEQDAAAVSHSIRGPGSAAAAEDSRGAV